MVEELQDHSGGNPHTIMGTKKRAWEHLKRRYHLFDTFVRHSWQLQFSWSNQQLTTKDLSATRVLRRIDRCYAPTRSPSLHFVVTSRIVVGQYLSDPIIMLSLIVRM